MREQGWALVWFVNGQRDKRAPYLRDLDLTAWTGNRFAAHLWPSKAEAEGGTDEAVGSSALPDSARARLLDLSGEKDGPGA